MPEGRPTYPTDEKGSAMLYVVAMLVSFSLGVLLAGLLSASAQEDMGGHGHWRQAILSEDGDSPARFSGMIDDRRVPGSPV